MEIMSATSTTFTGNGAIGVLLLPIRATVSSVADTAIIDGVLIARCLLSVPTHEVIP